MGLNPHFWTTTVGSFPHVEARELSAKLVSALDIPGWPQLPARSFRENMYVQYSASLPGIRLNESEGKIRFDTHSDLTPDLESFYEHFLADDLDYFSLSQ